MTCYEHLYKKYLVCRDIYVRTLTYGKNLKYTSEEALAPKGSLKHPKTPLGETNTMEHALLTGKDCNLCIGKGDFLSSYSCSCSPKHLLMPVTEQGW